MITEYRKLSEINLSEYRKCKCHICGETFIDDLPHLSTVNKSCPNGCRCVLAWCNNEMEINDNV